VSLSRCAAIALSLALCCAAPRAYADPCSDEVTLGDDGQIDAFLVAGPMRAPGSDAAGWDPLRHLDPSTVRLSASTPAGVLRVESGVAATRLPKGPRPAVAYSLLVLECAAPTTVYLATGGHGGVEIRLNGQAVLSRSQRRTGNADTELSTLPLEAGANLVSVRTFHSTLGPWRLFARLLGPGLGGPLQSVKARLPGYCAPAPVNKKEVSSAKTAPAPYLEECASRSDLSLARCQIPSLTGRAKVVQLFHRSSVDGGWHPYALYIPPGYDPKRTRSTPLVVVLHGLDGTPLSFLKTSLGIERPKEVTPQAFERMPATLPNVAAFVLAPEGMGNSGFRTYGEADVLDAMADVMARFPIDGLRVSITGASMGGTGTALIALRHAELFSVAAPLCGYHDVSKYDDLRHVTLLPFERHLVQAWSSFEWAKNGRQLPMRIVHGSKDGPAQSATLVRAYREAGYNLEYEEPALGHNVWDLTYAGSRFVANLSRMTRQAHPHRVSLRTTGSGPTRAHWLRLDSAPSSNAWTELEGSASERGFVSVLTRNAQALSIARDPVALGSTLRGFEIDGRRFAVEDCKAVADPFADRGDGPSTRLPRFADAVHLFHKDEGQWVCGQAPQCPECKQAGLAGPICAAFEKPLLFVYSTADPQEEKLTRRLAERLALPHSNITLALPIKADRDVTEDELRTHSLAIVGTPWGNRLLARVKQDLVFDIRKGMVAGRTFLHRGDGLSVVFAQRSPFASDQYLLVYSGTGPEGLWHTPDLPQLLPDYVIYDAAPWLFTGGRVLQGRQVLEAGFFDAHWRLPPPPLDENPY
jgi:predicted esterase